MLSNLLWATTKLGLPQKASNGHFSKNTLTDLCKHPILTGIISKILPWWNCFFLFLIDGAVRILKYTSSIHFISLLMECWKSRRYLRELLDTQSIIPESCFKMWKQPSGGVLKSNYPKNLKITIFFYIICKILEKFLCKSLFSIMFYRNSLQLELERESSLEVSFEDFIDIFRTTFFWNCPKSITCLQ